MASPARMLWAMHLAGNALLMWFAYYWLGVGESTVPRLVWSALLAILIMAAALWLHGSSFVFFKTDRAALQPSIRTALRNLLPLLLLAIGTLIVYGLLQWWQVYSTQPAFKTASYLTLKIRKPIKPATIEELFNGVLWIVRWAILPIVLLPLASSIANRGWQGFDRKTWKRSRQWGYWIQIVILLVAGIWLPLKLLGWVPHFSAFAMQMISFVIRLVIAYLLFVAAWIRVAQVS